MTVRLIDVREGMTVYDRDGHSIGTVDWVHMSDEDPLTPEAESVTGSPDMTSDRDSLIDRIADAFRGESIPEELRERMVREGFVKVDASGLFAHDRFVLPDQIRAIEGDRLMLTADKEELIRRM